MIVQNAGQKEDKMDIIATVDEMKEWGMCEDTLQYCAKHGITDFTTEVITEHRNKIPYEDFIFLIERVDPSYLPQVMKDSDEDVRLTVADRIDISYLPQMIGDSDWAVRLTVAERIDISYLPQMVEDSNWAVRQAVAGRMRIEEVDTLPD